jgi:hypothetical protein
VGWASRGSIEGGAGTYGATSGPRILTFFTRELQVGDGAVSVQIPGTSTSGVGAFIMLMRKASSESWVLGDAVFGVEAANTSTPSAVLSGAPGFATGDWAILGAAATPNTAYSGTTVTATGATFAALIEHADGGINPGGIATHIYAARTSVTAGSSLAVPSVATTSTGSSSAVFGLLRIRVTSGGALSATAEEEPARVGVTLNGWTSDDATTVYRVHEDGTRHEVRGGSLVPSAGQGFVWDYEYPTNEGFYYVADDSGTERSSATVADVVYRTNWNTNPTFAVDTAGWGAAYGTGGAGNLTRVASGGPVNSGPFGRLTWTTASTVVGNTGFNPPVAPCLPGQYGSARGWVRTSIVNRLVFYIQYLDVANATLLSTNSAGLVTAANSWVEINWNPAVPAPDNTTKCRLLIYTIPGTSASTFGVGNTFDTDRSLLEVTNLPPVVVGSYFDGDTLGAGYRWTAGAHSSPSQQYAREVQGETVYPDTRSWLRSPGLPGLDVVCRFGSVPERVHPRPTNFLAPIGRTTLVPQSSARTRGQYTLQIVTMDEAEAEALLVFMSGTPTAWLLFPGTRLHATYVALADLQERTSPKVGPTETVWTVQATEVSRPAGGTLYDPTASWQTLLDTSSSWQAVANSYPTWLDVLRGPGV